MGRHGRFENFRIGPWISNRIELERPIRIESNLEASQVPNWKRFTWHYLRAISGFTVQLPAAAAAAAAAAAGADTR